jgi:hypothetical protein
MLHSAFSLISTPAASLLAGLFGVFVLIILRQHRDRVGNASPPKIVACFLLGIVSYTLLILVVGNFAFRIPISLAISAYGDDRMAWLMLGLLADTFARLYRLYES